MSFQLSANKSYVKMPYQHLMMPEFNLRWYNIDDGSGDSDVGM